MASGGVQRGKRELEGRKDPGDADLGSAGDSVADELGPALERLGAAGLPLIIVVEDLHEADETLVGLLVRLLVAQSSRVLLVTTCWPGLLAEPGRPCSVLLGRSTEERVRRVDAAGLPNLSLQDRVQLCQAVLPKLGEEGAGILAKRYSNPWALQLACSSGAVQRGLARGSLTSSAVDSLPSDIGDLFRLLWSELPAGVRGALMLSVLSAPTSVGLSLNFGEDRWDPALVQAALSTEGWLREHARELIADLDLAEDAYSWVQTVDEWLQRFHDPAQREVALTAAQAEYGQDERLALYSALTQRLGDDARLSEAQRAHGDRLLLALAAEGFLPVDHLSVVPAAARVCQVLGHQVEVKGLKQALGIAEMILQAAPDGDEGVIGPWVQLRSTRARTLGRLGRHAAAVEANRQLLADQERVLGPDAPDTLTTRNNLAYWQERQGDT